MKPFRAFSRFLCALISASLLLAQPPAVQAAPAQKQTQKKPAAKKSAAKKPAAKKPAAKKSSAKKTTAKKSSAKKTAAKKSTAKKTTAKKSAKTAANKKNNRKKAAAAAVPAVGALPKTVQAHTYADEDADKKMADDLLMGAMGLLGVSYRFGGSNPASGLDCSGFIQYIFRETVNVNLPRTSAAMATVGTKVEKHELRPGDLVFFAKKKRIDHVGMYIGDDKFIHAPRTGKDIEIQSLNGNYYTKHYVTARRVHRESVLDGMFDE